MKFNDLIARGLYITLVGIDGAYLVSRSDNPVLVNYLAKHAPSCCWMAHSMTFPDGTPNWGKPVESGVLVGGEPQDAL